MAIFDFMHRQVAGSKFLTFYEKELAGETAMRELALDIAISYIAGAISKCEFKRFKNSKEEKDELYYRFNVSPNPNQNSTQFLTQVVNQLVRNGEALVIKKSNGIYCADGFSVEEKGLNANIFQNISVNNENIPGRISANDVFYYRLENSCFANSVRAANAPYCDALSAAIKAYKRNVGKKYKLEIAAHKAGDKDFQEEYQKVISKQLKSFLESETGVYPQFNGYNLEDITSALSSSGVADIVSLRKEIFETTMNAWKIPMSMVYGNMTNVNDVVNQFLTFCIDPFADLLSEETTRKTATFKDWQKGDYIKVDTSCIKHVDVLELADNISKYVSSGLPTLDEARDRVGLPPEGGELGKKHFITKNFEDIENLNQIKE